MASKIKTTLTGITKPTASSTNKTTITNKLAINVGEARKRNALENISNSTTSSTTTSNANNNNNHNQSIDLKDAKKTRVSSTSSSSSASSTTSSSIRKYESLKTNASSKPITTTTTAATLSLNTAKPGAKENVPPVKKAVLPTFPTRKPTTVSQNLETNLEHQMATTTITQLRASDVTGWDDIDKDDFQDEFSSHDYVEYIFNYYREREERFKVDDYIKRQPCINKQMRLLLVDWMVEVQQQLEFNHEVLYLSVKLLDLYLNSRKIEKEKLQLLGGAAMFIACKFEERMPPIIDDFIYVSDNAYDRDQLIKMEIEILKTVKFDIGCPLSYTFLRRYSKCVKADMKFLTLARYILELSLQDYSFSYLSDSLKACASLYLAMKMTVAYEKANGTTISSDKLIVSTANLQATEWTPTLIHYSGSFLKDFIELVPLMNNLIKQAPASKYKTIFDKYSHQVFYHVAKIPALSDQELLSLNQECHKNHQLLVQQHHQQ